MGFIVVTVKVTAIVFEQSQSVIKSSMIIHVFYHEVAGMERKVECNMIGNRRKENKIEKNTVI